MPGSQPRPAAPGLQITHYLRDAALVEDWRGWAAAWQQLDSKECARLSKALDEGKSISLTLCGERNAQTWSSGGSSIFTRMGNLFGRKSASALLQNL